ncbi:MAG: flagellar filament capping protein FliD [candidate division Zixibacteria bacterium]|nr:flagellar filament capping protein FliD [candidate division Zixibacteria bacterium]
MSSIITSGPAFGQNTIVGITSGLDTGLIVDSILQFERFPAILLEARQSETTNKITTYKALEARLLALSASLTSLRRGDIFDNVSTQVSDEEVLSVTSSGGATIGQFDFRVLQLARNHQLASQGIDDPTASGMGTGTIQISVGDASAITITITASNNSLIGIKEAINNSDTGVTAAIINDGSFANAYRLVLTSNETGASNTISITSSLSGGTNLDYTNSSFEAPETENFSALASSAVSLGAGASYSGAENKIYTFTIAGTGTQTVGSGDITVNWSDGTNSGSITVSAADTEITLTGTGSDGLTVSFGAGDLIAGDTFTVSSFAPTLQNPSDAKLSYGSSDGGGSPIIITSTSNEFTEAIPGLTIKALTVSDAGTAVNVSVSRDKAGVKSALNSFISAYNSVMSSIDDQFSYDVENETSGVLFTERILFGLQVSIRAATTSLVSNLEGKINSLATIGVRTGLDGRLSLKDPNALDDALDDNPELVRRLFADGGTSDNSGIKFVAAGDKTKTGLDYIVDITQNATLGHYQGAGISDLASSSLVIDSTNNKLKIVVDGVSSSEIVLTEGTYTSGTQLAKEIQSKIDADELIGQRGVKVSWTDSGSDGYLTFTSGQYGSTSTVSFDLTQVNAANAILGLSIGTRVSGFDVAGTINGENATGVGQILTGDDGNSTTDGLRLRVTLDSNGIVSGSEATVSFTRGVAARLKQSLDSITNSTDGIISRRVKALTDQVADFRDQIARIDARLEFRRFTLEEEFRKMEQALTQLNAQNQFLINGLNALRIL